MNELDKNYENKQTGHKGPSDYIGDGAYIQFRPEIDDYIIYTSNGFGMDQRVYIDYRDMEKLIAFHNIIKEMGE